MNKKRGFTLIELLAVIVILAIVLVIVIPKIGDITTRSKNNAFFSAAKSILRKIDYKNIDIDLTSGTSLSSFNLSEISTEDYDLENSKIYILDDNIYINLVGLGRFQNMNVCKVTTSSREYTVIENACPLINGIPLTVNLGGGSTTQLFNLQYEENETINLKTPTKRGYTFTSWNVSGGTINNNILTIGNSNTTITANWAINPGLIVNLNGGSTTQIFNNNYRTGSTIALLNPTKRGYTFTSWSVSGGTINNNILTIGNSNTTITANWVTNPSLIVDLDGGSTTQIFKTNYQLEEEITLITPTKANHAFTGWSVTGGTINNNVLTIESSNATITAGWELTMINFRLALDGGETSQEFEDSYEIGATIELIKPTKNGYIFNGWTQVGGGLEGNVLTITNSNITLTANWLEYEDMFTYIVNGNPGVIDTDYNVINDDNGNWRIKFLTSGSFTPLVSMEIDAFLVGGGGGGGAGNNTLPGGGSGGFTANSIISLVAHRQYTVVIGAGGAGANAGGFNENVGADGGQSSIEFSGVSMITADGGGAGRNNNYSPIGGTGGSGGGGSNGGIGGIDGGNGSGTLPGLGQGTTTREFGEADGTLYSTGGKGQDNSIFSGASAGANTGDGGGAGKGNGSKGGAGGSGIVIIRNHRVA